MTTSLATKPREYWMVSIKTKRARVWHPVAIYTKRSHAEAKYLNLRKTWSDMDARMSIVREAA